MQVLSVYLKQLNYLWTVAAENIWIFVIEESRKTIHDH